MGAGPVNWSRLVTSCKLLSHVWFNVADLIIWHIKPGTATPPIHQFSHLINECHHNTQAHTHTHTLTPTPAVGVDSFGVLWHVCGVQMVKPVTCRNFKHLPTHIKIQCHRFNHLTSQSGMHTRTHTGSETNWIYTTSVLPFVICQNRSHFASYVWCVWCVSVDDIDPLNA